MGITDADLRDVRGNRHSTTESVALANERFATADAQRAAKEKREADAFEAELKARFMAAVPGTTEADWQRQRQQVLDDARRAAVQSEDDKARQALRANYM